MLCILVTSRDSSSVISGRIPGILDAIILFPQPGSPMQGSAPEQAGVQQGAALTEANAVNALPGQAEVGYQALPNIAKKTARAVGESLAN